MHEYLMLRLINNNNITPLFTAVPFMNKKTFIPLYDDYIFVENGLFIMQDLNKTYTLYVEALKNCGYFLISKENLLSLKTKNTKYFIKEVANNTLTITAVRKASKKNNANNNLSETYIDTVIPIERNKNLANTKIIDNEYLYKNSLLFNGINLKKMLKGYKDNLGFKFIDNKFILIMNDTDIDFISNFNTTCDLKISATDDSVVFIDAPTLYNALQQLELVKNNNLIEINFSQNSFLIQHDNTKIYILSLSNDY